MKKKNSKEIIEKLSLIKKQAEELRTAIYKLSDFSEEIIGEIEDLEDFLYE